MRQLDRWIKDRMPEVAAINDAVFYLFKMCLASLIHHREWLNESLHSESPIRMTSFWYEDIPLANHVTTKFPWTRTSDTPEFTGIPIDVLYMAKIEEQNAIIARLEERLIQDNNRVVSEITQHIDTALDDRAVGGESFSMGRDIIKKLDTLITRSEQDYAHQVDNATNDHTGNDDGGGAIEEETIEFTIEEETILQEQARDTAVKERTKTLIENRKKNGLMMGFHNGILTPLLPTYK